MHLIPVGRYKLKCSCGPASHYPMASTDCLRRPKQAKMPCAFQALPPYTKPPGSSGSGKSNSIVTASQDHEWRSAMVRGIPRMMVVGAGCFYDARWSDSCRQLPTVPTIGVFPGSFRIRICGGGACGQKDPDGRRRRSPCRSRS
jgi:hypothetical protein